MDGVGFREMEAEAALFINVIDELIPIALPALAGGFDSEQLPAICNQAVPGTC